MSAETRGEEQVKALALHTLLPRVAQSAAQRNRAMFILPLHLLIIKLMEIRRQPPAPLSMATA